MKIIYIWADALICRSLRSLRAIKVLRVATRSDVCAMLDVDFTYASDTSTQVLNADHPQSHSKNMCAGFKKYHLSHYQ